MHQNTIAWQQEIAAPAMKGVPSPDVHLINMVYALSLELTANPTICADGADGLWIYYEGACFACEELLQEYGLSLAVISRRYPLRFYGNAGGLESVELESALSADGQRLTLMKKNVSGQDFDQISNLCLRIKAGSAPCRDAIKAALSALDYRRDYLALRRTSYAQQALADAGELNPDTYYRYIPLSGDGEATGGSQSAAGASGRAVAASAAGSYFRPGAVLCAGGCGAGGAVQLFYLGAVSAPGHVKIRLQGLLWPGRLSADRRRRQTAAIRL